MKKFCLLLLSAVSAALLQAAPAVTNAVPVAAVAVTNAPAAKAPRTQCEAVTKSGTRCKRNAVPGRKLCRQHQKILDARR